MRRATRINDLYAHIIQLKNVAFWRRVLHSGQAKLVRRSDCQSATANQQPIWRFWHTATEQQFDRTTARSDIKHLRTTSAATVADTEFVRHFFASSCAATNIELVWKHLSNSTATTGFKLVRRTRSTPAATTDIKLVWSSSTNPAAATIEWGRTVWLFYTTTTTWALLPWTEHTKPGWLRQFNVGCIPASATIVSDFATSSVAARQHHQPSSVYIQHYIPHFHH